jgi:hypothetical protein
MGLRAGKKTPSACGKACGIENCSGEWIRQRPIGRFHKQRISAVKAMSSNQLYNSRGINIDAKKQLLISLQL